MANMVSRFAKSGGGNFVPSLSSFSLESSYKFLHQLVQVDFVFHCVCLGFRV
jgi:hypothetical protein